MVKYLPHLALVLGGMLLGAAITTLDGDSGPPSFVVKKSARIAFPKSTRSAAAQSIPVEIKVRQRGEQVTISCTPDPNTRNGTVDLEESHVALPPEISVAVERGVATVVVRQFVVPSAEVLARSWISDSQCSSQPITVNVEGIGAKKPRIRGTAAGETGKGDTAVINCNDARVLPPLCYSAEAT